MEDSELVNVTLNGFPMRTICQRSAWEHLPKWERLCDDCIQVEACEESKANKKGDGEDNLALVSMARKGKGKGSKGIFPHDVYPHVSPKRGCGKFFPQMSPHLGSMGNMGDAFPLCTDIYIAHNYKSSP